MVLNGWRNGYGVVLGIKMWFNELFDGYLVVESMWGFRVLIGKRMSAFGFATCKEGGKNRVLWCPRVTWMVPVKSTTGKKRR